MLKDIGHPYAEGKTVYDITFENIQAGERTSHLFRIANLRNALVVGTGDLSELALGWCTYGVGDHMSHYNVNASVPKTLIQHLIRWVARSVQFSPETSEILLDILETEISPELIPGRRGAQPSQRTEAIVGPYELQDFNNFYTTRFGYLPTKIAFMAYCAWRDRDAGPLAGRPRGEEKRLHDRRDPALAGGLSLPVLPDQPVQALLHPQRPQGRFGGIPLAAGRLPGAKRQRGRRLAGRCEKNSGKG